MWLGFWSRIAFYVTVLCGLYITFWGLRPLFFSTSSTVIDAFTRLVASLKLGSVMGYAWGALSTSLYVAERGAKKRAIHAKSDLQHRLEAQEPNRTTSGLTSTGGTPKER